MSRDAVLTIAAVLWIGAVLSPGAAQGQVQSRPKPVAPPLTAPVDPAPAKPQPPSPQGVPAQPPAGAQTPSEATLGVPLYPNMQFIESYNAGAGQRFYQFGATAAFADVVAYYRSVLKQRGELVFEEPPTHQFDLGRFREETMAFPPSVTVKDFSSGGLQGYPNPVPGAEPARFRTVVQIVPVPAEAEAVRRQP